MVLGVPILKHFRVYTGKLFHCYMLDKFICHFMVSSLFCRFYSIFDGK